MSAVRTGIALMGIALMGASYSGCANTDPIDRAISDYNEMAARCADARLNERTLPRYCTNERTGDVDGARR